MRLSFIEPMLPTLVEVPPEGDNWIHEIKYDGYRTQIAVDGSEARAYTRRGAEWSAKYRTILDEAVGLKLRSAIIDGEMYLPAESGASDFSAFRRAIKGSPKKLLFMAFDLLHLDGRELRRLPLIERKVLLSGLIPTATGRIRFSEHVVGGGKAFYRAVDDMGLEGMVSKRPDSAYRSGRTDTWLKTKCYALSEFEVAGVLAERGKPTVALMVDSDRNYVGGAFITSRSIKERLLARVRSNAGPLPKGMTAKPDAQWLEPGTMATVRHLRGEEELRHASLRDIRD